MHGGTHVFGSPIGQPWENGVGIYHFSFLFTVGFFLGRRGVHLHQPQVADGHQFQVVGLWVLITLSKIDEACDTLDAQTLIVLQLQTEMVLV